MIRKLAVLFALLPIAAFAQGAGPGPKGGAGAAPSDEKMERMVKRARLARNLGLAEALDLDTAQATRLADSLSKLDEKRVALHKQQHEAHQLLRRAAQGEKVSAADVDGALARIFDVRAQVTALDKETLGVVT